jgi:type II secretory pathway pseudopilin PulG
MRYLWVSAIALAVLAIVLVLASVEYGGSNRSDQATFQAQNITKAIRSYHAKTGGTWPTTLHVLTGRDPETGVGPFLEGGESAITDPWGNPYQYEIRADDPDGEHVVVWTTGPGGERIQWPRDQSSEPLLGVVFWFGRIAFVVAAAVLMVAIVVAAVRPRRRGVRLED